MALKPPERPCSLSISVTDIPQWGYLAIKKPVKKSACHNNNKKKEKICLRSMQWMKMSLHLSGCSEENTLQPRREKGGARMPCQQVRAKAFCFLSPRDRVERYTFLCGFCSFPSLVYAPPADLIMSMPPETRYNNFFPLQWHF